MPPINDNRWQRRGFALLWDAETLNQFARPEEAVTMREFFSIAEQWPERLPSVNGNAMIVVGLEGCLDMLTPQDGETWLNEDFRNRIFSFQGEYENQAALIFWLPDGKRRVKLAPASEEYLWVCGGPYGNQTISLGRCLWSGAESDAKRIVNPYQPTADPDGVAWVGLYHPRIS
jgi:hypothetical protein